MAGATRDPTDVLGLVGESTRSDILLALLEYRREHPEEPAVAYSELRERAGVEDKGNFNYHLDQLRRHFVDKNEDGYRLTKAGELVGGAILSEVYGGRSESELLDTACPICGASVIARLKSGQAFFRCEDGHLLFYATIPPSVADDRTSREIAALATLRQHQLTELSDAGACPMCFGPVEDGIVPRDDDATRHQYRSACQRCGHFQLLPPEGLAVNHPAVVALGHEHGVDVRRTPLWELWGPEAFHATEAVSEDPMEVRVTMTMGGDAVRLTYDEDATVVEVEEGLDADAVDPVEGLGVDELEPTS